MAQHKFYKHAMFDDNRAEALGPLGDLLGVRMRRVDIILNRCMTSVTEELNLKPSTLLCLGLIITRPGLSQNALTLQTTNDKSTIVGVVDQLEALGWARRELFASDRRRHALFPTKEGESAFNKIAKALKKKEAELLSEISDSDLKYLANLLDKMHDSCVQSLDILDTPIMTK